MKLGARILKTGIAITLAIMLAEMLHFPSPAFAGIAAIFAIQPSIYRSYLTVIEQVQANIIGAVVAVLFGISFGTNPFIIGLTAVITIAICLKLKIENTIAIALVTVIAILETTGDDFVQFATIRFLTILLGVLSAFFVNLIFMPPKYETKLYHKITEISHEIMKWIRINIRNKSEFAPLKEEIDKIKDQLIKLDHLFLLYKEERIYSKAKVLPKSRKLVLYRQMIITTNRAFYTLRQIHCLENELRQIPRKLHEMLISELDFLLILHEQALLKITKKIKNNHDEDLLPYDKFNRKEFIQAFLKFEKEAEDSDSFYQILSLVSAIVDYHDQLEHLDTLINSFQHFHKKENKIHVEDEE
ncbi:aromatic acid exporter family protein [Aeribacillus composti]|uniref:FUSC family protein n=1 Tax=Aeribacillus composti TaxID=1868734 RepID=UPI002E1CDDCC|nr:aromatic acid exporter family protein [Aeribacillus composti]MED0744322.1 aromatic acid exporter family protein [Aeribacillus composti]